MIHVFMRVRRQLTLVHIVFHIEEIVRNSLVNQLIKTECIGVLYVVDNYVVRVIHVKMFITKHESVLV